MDRQARRNPVIVIPGILGSVLRDSSSGRQVWGAFSGDYADPGRPADARLIALPMRQGSPLTALRDEVYADHVLDRLKIDVLGLPISLNAYREVLSTLGVGGYRDEALGESGAIDYGDDHYTCFQFPYDWRRDNVENARRLHAFILEKRAAVAEEIHRRFGVDRPEVRFDIVAHSMGGLLARYYLRYGQADLPADGKTPIPTWAGAEYVDRVILVGTPNAGSLHALMDLAHGKHLAAILPEYPAAVLGTMPSIYQLLPRPRHGAVRDRGTAQSVGDFLDADLWVTNGWGLADPNQGKILEGLLPAIDNPAQRRAIALDHQRKCLQRARHFFAALDTPSTPSAHLELYLFVGDSEATLAEAELDSATGKLAPSATQPGDRTVTRASALMDERVDAEWTPQLRTPIAWSGVTFLFADHLGLTKSPAFTDNVLYLLLEKPRRQPAPVRPSQ